MELDLEMDLVMVEDGAGIVRVRVKLQNYIVSFNEVGNQNTPSISSCTVAQQSEGLVVQPSTRGTTWW